MQETMKYSNKQGRHFLRNSVNRTFIECVTTGTIHTQDCPILKRILVTNKRSCKAIPKNSSYCSFCKKKLLILSSAAEKYPQVDNYANLFSSWGFSEEYLEKFLALEYTKMLIFDARTIMFFVKNDFWKIHHHPTGALILYHNNYDVLQGERYFHEGFHIQKLQNQECAGSPDLLLQKMVNYSWDSNHISIRPQDTHKGPPEWDSAPSSGYKEGYRWHKLMKSLRTNHKHSKP